ncbi:MAG: branched-chain amino acid transport system II carrier protein [Enterococcus sp.]
MEKKLSFKEYLFIGSMLFGLFFGAGNLIFPVHMGQEAGSHVFLANLGFLITGIGLPFLGVIAIGLSQKNGVYEVAQRVNKPYAKFFTILLYLVIGPFYAIPRLATTSYEVGIAPFMPTSLNVLGLALFSCLFFFVVWVASRKPSKILDYVGKFLNPLFLVLLGFLLLMAFLNPMAGVSDAPVQGAYQSAPFFTGFTEGYNTLDALAALAFGIVVVNTIKGMGVEKPKTIAIDTVKAGSISIVLMGIIYTLLSYMGTMSLGGFAMSDNGGIALAQIANYYLGIFGSVLLAMIVIVACLKTGIGLITAFSETFIELFPKRSYGFFIALATISSCLFANVGLTKIIEFSIPVLMFIYPLAITLILLTIFGQFFNHDRLVYQVTTYFTLVAAIFDGLNASPSFIHDLPFVQSLLTFAQHYLPFFTIGMGWLVPAALGFILSFAKIKFFPSKELASNC